MPLILGGDDLTGDRAADRRDAGLPRNQQHYLREGIFLGKATADARLRRIRHRYAISWRTLNPAANGESLFFDEVERDEEGKPEQIVTRTWLLDDMELAELDGGRSDDR